MIAIGLWAMPSTSRITPPTPVFAPPNGSTADGWLWVSAFERERRALGELDDAGVADEGRPHERCVDLLGARPQLLHQRDRSGGGRESPGSVAWMIARKVLCAAVLAPGLGERLELDVGRVTVDLSKWSRITRSSSGSR